VYIYVLIGVIFNNQTNLIHSRFFSWFVNNSGPRPIHRGGFRITLRNITLGRFLWTSDQLGNTTRQHTTFTTDRKPCPGRDSNPQSQPANDRRPMPQIARPPGSACLIYRNGIHICQNKKYYEILKRVY